ncbi:protein kinase, partial [Mycobacterium sp. E2733]|uniref:serine/threonine protein kinase n=1 Tax=Mycobacterium sp. E2733 TaxID=1834138 RepID=UPI0007FD8903
AYMSPERLNTGQADARADIYALACVLYEALTGSRPYPGDSLEQQIVGHLTTPPPRPSTRRPGVPEGMDAVIAKGMAKDPDQRYATTVEFAHAAREATTAPTHPPVWTDQPTAGPIHGHDTLLAPTATAPVLPPAAPLEVTPTPQRPRWRRPHVVIPALLATAVLIGAGVFAAVNVSHHHKPTAGAPPAAAPNTGPFTGVYTANFEPETRLDGEPWEGAAPATETWGVRSVCRPGGCVATASRRSGQTTLSTLVFDEVGGRWLAVGLGSGRCNNVPAEFWKVFTLQPQPDGTLSGDYNSTTSNACDQKRAVSFTRTGDVDVTNLPDPAGQPPRVVSPAEALRGRYHETVTFVGRFIPEEYDYAVRTDCLRSGERCMSYFHNPKRAAPLVFGGGTWTRDVEGDVQCPGGGTTHAKVTAQYPLPQPLQDPITPLTGHGHRERTGACGVGQWDFDSKLVRTGD